MSAIFAAVTAGFAKIGIANINVIRAASACFACLWHIAGFGAAFLGERFTAAN
jgi:uncharacterized membrane protein